MNTSITFAVSNKMRKRLDAIANDLSKKYERRITNGDLIRKAIKHVYGIGSTKKTETKTQDRSCLDPSKEKALLDIISQKSEFSFSDVSRIIKKVYGLEIGRKKLFRFLREHGLLDRRNRPEGEYVNSGHFTIKRGEKNWGYSYQMTMATKKGILLIIEELAKAGFMEKPCFTEG